MAASSSPTDTRLSVRSRWGGGEEEEEERRRRGGGEGAGGGGEEKEEGERRSSTQLDFVCLGNGRQCPFGFLATRPQVSYIFGNLVTKRMQW